MSLRGGQPCARRLRRCWRPAPRTRTATRRSGSILSSECVTCHQITGRYDGIPPIVGWPKPVFIEIMGEYRAKKRANPVMQTIAVRLTEEEIAALAAYFGSLTAGQLSNTTAREEDHDVIQSPPVPELQAAALIAASGLPMPALAQAKPKLVVVGGGPGGATVAKYVAKDPTARSRSRWSSRCGSSSPASTPTSISAASRRWESITHSYDKLASKYGVKLVHQAAQAIDRDKKQRPARRRIAAGLRPAGGRARHRSEIRSRSPAIPRRHARDHAARLEGRAADPAAQAHSSTRSRTAASS